MINDKIKYFLYYSCPIFIICTAVCCGIVLKCKSEKEIFTMRLADKEKEIDSLYKELRKNNEKVIDLETLLETKEQHITLDVNGIPPHKRNRVTKVSDLDTCR